MLLFLCFFFILYNFVGSAEGDKDTEFNKKLSLASSNSVLVESEKYKVKQSSHMISALANGNARGCNAREKQGMVMSFFFSLFCLFFFKVTMYITISK